ncbi:MAG: hypothetical protein HYW49_13070 [Deltaproteobacteria bacterium]|nr:hypothetical protein [Deltaproteobacteria bacterium]
MTDTAALEETKPMTFEEYLDFLDEYWEMFGPPPPREPQFTAEKMLF